MNYLKPDLKDQLFDFCNQMLETRDYDPNYFAVKGFVEALGLSELEKYEFCFIFNGFYHFGSADEYLRKRPKQVELLQYGKSRRGFMGNRKILQFISGGLELRSFIFKCRNGGEVGWENIYNALLKIKGCGHWSAYYLCDMFKVILGFNITSPNLGFLSSNTENRGPMSGLRFITGIPEAELRKDPRLHKKIYREMLEGVKFEGMEQFESLLCNFLSLHKKSYYVGRDIDRQIKMMNGLDRVWWDARVKYFPDELLGEKHGWDGIRKNLMGTFTPNKRWT